MDINLKKLSKDDIEEYLTNLYTELKAYNNEKTKLRMQIETLTQDINNDSSYTKRNGITQKVADMLLRLQSKYCAFSKMSDLIEEEIEKVEKENKFAKDFVYDSSKIGSVIPEDCVNDVIKQVNKDVNRVKARRVFDGIKNKVFKFVGSKKINLPKSLSKKLKQKEINNMSFNDLTNEIYDYMTATDEKRVSSEYHDLAKEFIQNQYLQFSQLLNKKNVQENEQDKTDNKINQERVKSKVDLYRNYINFDLTNGKELVADMGEYQFYIDLSDKEVAFDVLEDLIDVYEASKLKGMSDEDFLAKVAKEKNLKLNIVPETYEQDLEKDSKVIDQTEKPIEDSKEDVTEGKPKLNPADISNVVENQEPQKKESEILQEKFREEREVAKELYNELYAKLDDVQAKKQAIYDEEKQRRKEVSELYGVHPTAIEDIRTEEDAHKLEELDKEEEKIKANISSELQALNDMNRDDYIKFKKEYDAKVKEENFDPVKAELKQMDETYWAYKNGKKGAHFTDEVREKVLVDLEKERAEFVKANGLEEKNEYINPIDQLNDMDEIKEYIMNEFSDEEIEKLEEYKELFVTANSEASEVDCYRNALKSVENDRTYQEEELSKSSSR